MVTRFFRVALGTTLLLFGNIPARAATPGDGSPPIDTYLYDGRSTKPCMRTPLSNGTVFYSCRILSRILDTTIQNNSASVLGVTKVRTGKISGGSSSNNSIYQLTVPALDRRGIIIYEGCDYKPENKVYVCGWRATGHSSTNPKTGSQFYYLNALDKTVTNTYTVVGCVQTIYDAYKQAGAVDPAQLADCVNSLVNS